MKNAGSSFLSLTERIAPKLMSASKTKNSKRHAKILSLRRGSGTASKEKDQNQDGIISSLNPVKPRGIAFSLGSETEVKASRLSIEGKARATPHSSFCFPTVAIKEGLIIQERESSFISSSAVTSLSS